MLYNFASNLKNTVLDLQLRLNVQMRRICEFGELSKQFIVFTFFDQYISDLNNGLFLKRGIRKQNHMVIDTHTLYLLVN
jgi:hypothetical protein